MEHKEYIRICEGSNTAVLFIHGIVGTPNHFEKFISLIPDSVSVYNMLLDGHGKKVKDFSKTSMKKWEEQVATVVEQLSLTHQKIYVVAHSLGTLLAIEQAIKNKSIAKLFLLAVPLNVSIKPKMLTNSGKVYFDRIRPEDSWALAAKACYGIDQDRNPFHYLGWIPRFLELFDKIRQVRKMIKSLNTTCWVYQSEKDEMVSGKSIKILEQNPCISINRLANSGHYYYDSSDWEKLITDFKKYLIPTSNDN